MPGLSFPPWSGFNFVPTLHSQIPEALRNQPLPEGLIVCITGASRGIGAEIAKTFAAAGAAGLILTARSEAALQETHAACISLSPHPANLRITLAATDVTSEAQVRALAARIAAAHDGRLDVLINNAGVVSTDASAFDKLGAMAASQIRDIMDINYTGRFLTIQALLPLLLAASPTRTRTVIDISSISAHFTAGGPVGFNIAALASNRLVEALADAYGGEEQGGVLCYSVHPGMVGNARPPPGMPAHVNELCGDSADLCGAFLVWLLRERPAWLNGRYLSATWDVEELKARREEIVSGDKLKMRMVV